MDYKDIIALR